MASRQRLLGMSTTLDALWRDVRYTIRMWGRNPAFTAITVLVLASGIAANTAVFSVVSAILLRPLPGIADPGRLVSLYRIRTARRSTTWVTRTTGTTAIEITLC